MTADCETRRRCVVGEIRDLGVPDCGTADGDHWGAFLHRGTGTVATTKAGSLVLNTAKSGTMAQSGLSRIPRTRSGWPHSKKRDPKAPFSTSSPFPSGVLDQSPRRRLLVVRRHPVALGNRRSRVSIGGTPHTTFRAGFARAGDSSKRLTHFAFSGDTAGLPCRKDESVRIRCQDESVQICLYHPSYELDFRCSP